MKRATLLLTMTVVCLVLSTPALAVGPDDGLYLITETNPAFAPRLVYVSVHQNDNFLSNGFNILILNLNPSGTSWDYGLLRRTGNTVQGTLYGTNGQAYGSTSGTISDGTVNGQVIIRGVPFTLSGSRLF